MDDTHLRLDPSLHGWHRGRRKGHRSVIYRNNPASSSWVIHEHHSVKHHPLGENLNIQAPKEDLQIMVFLKF